MYGIEREIERDDDGGRGEHLHLVQVVIIRKNVTAVWILGFYDC